MTELTHHSARHREVVVVTGASAGLGRAIVERFARSGARLGIGAPGRERLKDTKRALQALGTDVLWESAPGAWGAHGSFDAVSHTRSTEWWLRKHLPMVTVIGMVLSRIARSTRDT